MSDKLDDLMKKENTALPLTLRYSAGQLASYKQDLMRLIEKIGEGKCMPALGDLRVFFLDTYGINVGEGTLRRHIKALKAGQPIWPK